MENEETELTVCESCKAETPEDYLTETQWGSVCDGCGQAYSDRAEGYSVPEEF